MYNIFLFVNTFNVNSLSQETEKIIMVDFGKRKTIIDKLLFAFKPKKNADIVAYAEKIIDDYTGITTIRSRNKARLRKKRATFLHILSLFAFPAILWFFFKIFF